MQTIQLYIEGERVDMFSDESVTLTDTIKNINDISKVFTEFSRSFSLPASKTNNKIFKHYYNYHIVDGYDARVRVTARIELNHVEYKKGFVKLEGVSLKNNAPHTYKVTFYGNTVSLKEKFGDDKLADLEFLDEFNTTYNGGRLRFSPGGIRDLLRNQRNVVIKGTTYSAPIQVPLMTHSQRLYYDSVTHIFDDGNLFYHTGSGTHQHGVKWNELKYAINLPIILLAIEIEYGITFSDDFFDTATNSRWKDLYMWLHRTKGKVTSGDQTQTFTYFVDDFVNATEDVSSMIAGSLRIYANSADIYQARVDITPNASSASDDYKFRIEQNNNVLFESSWGTGNRFYSIPATSIINGAPIRLYIITRDSFDVDDVEWEVQAEDSSGIVQIDTYTSVSFNIPAEFDFLIRDQIPDMKVIDFISGILKMFNLVTYVDPDNGEIVVKTLDNYYSAGTSYDITKYVDVKSSEVNSSLPFREVVYKYNGNKTYLAQVHTQLFNRTWGKEEYSGNSNTTFSGDIYKVTAPFEHMKFERLYDLDNVTQTDLQWGYSVDDNQQPYIGNPLIFYLNLQSGVSYSYVNAVDANNTGTNHVQNTAYWSPLNTNQRGGGASSTWDSLHFYPEVDEWTEQTNENTLFNDLHLSYIQSAFNISKRITKLTAYLPQRILINMTLADRFVINNQSYKINSIQTNLATGESKLELLNE
jgi:hypothetical protein